MGFNREDIDSTLDRLQKAAFEYFLHYSNPANGLVQDTSREGSPASIAVVGFALSCYPVGVERGWLERDKACDLTLSTLRFFAQSRQNSAADKVTGYKGFYYHFLDMKSGERVWNCELSVIDSTMLIAGVLTAGLYFDRDQPQEQELRDLAQQLYDKVDFDWAQDERGTLTQGWTPAGGFIHYDWEGYSEAILLYALAAASRDMPDMNRAYNAWTKTYQWEQIYDHDCLYAGPLFIHLFSHAWIDFREIQDPFMRVRNTDYFANTASAVAIQRDYCQRNPGNFAHYGTNSWGITACDGPVGELKTRDGSKRQFFGYAARGVPYGPDDGTLAPWAALATLPFSPDTSIACLFNMLENYPGVLEADRFTGSFNPSLPGKGPEGWVSPGCYGLDQGLVVMMIENFRSGMIWKLTRGSPIFRRGLTGAGFSGGWL